MAKPSEVPVDLQELEEEEERVERVDLIRTLSGMWNTLLYITRGYESYWREKM